MSSDSLNEERCTNAGMKKCNTYPRFDMIESGLVLWNPSPGMPRSKSATCLELFKNEMESNVNGISSTGRISSSVRSSPQIPAQRKISASRTSQYRSCSCGSIPPLKMCPGESNLEIENESHDENQKENVAYQRFYRAMYTYDSQDHGEVGFREGDEVEVIQRSENGWWLVRTPEELGWGPSNFLQSMAY